ncbi:MAG: helix-turn-helix domain-containing protein [Oscillospiraceae bacterium]|nr:helix-turn-helix domain-containing protein [Oscillospiraceae bacterium]
MKTEFSNRLGKLRRDNGLSQRQAATQLGISQALLSHYENGAREPKFEFVLDACKFYKVTADYLLGRTKQRKAEAEIVSGKIDAIISSLEELRKELTNDNKED